jgi:chitin disaccharide deacetylase
LLIINADDFGLDKVATDNILSCFEHRRISSATAMVFMADSDRSAKLAFEIGMRVGLHLNFTDRFTDRNHPSILSEYQERVAKFLLRNKYAQVLYNPFLRKEVEHLYKFQYEEFIRLYNRQPTHFDGHNHMHLCTNFLIRELLPLNSRARRSFSFCGTEKSMINRVYRSAVDAWLRRKYRCVDKFFSIQPIQDYERLRRIVKLSLSYNVELMVHPQRSEEYQYLMSEEFLSIINDAEIGTYSML